MSERIKLNQQVSCDSPKLNLQWNLMDSTKDTKNLVLELSSSVTHSQMVFYCLNGSFLEVKDISDLNKTNLPAGKDYFEIPKLVTRKKILVPWSSAESALQFYIQKKPYNLKSIVYELDMSGYSTQTLPKISNKDALKAPETAQPVTKTQPLPSAISVNAKSLEECFGNTLHEIYIAMQDSKKWRSQFKPIALAQEMGYLNNIYRYILFARSEGFQKSEDLHKIILEIIEGIARQIPVVSTKVEEYKKKWEEWNFLLRKYSLATEISLRVLPVLNIKYGIRQANNFYEMIEELKKNIAEILEAQKKLLDLPPFQEITKNLKFFMYKLDLFKSSLSKFKIEEVHPHYWLKECLDSMQELFEKSLAYFILIPKDFWLQIEKFWDIVFDHYRILWNFTSSESGASANRLGSQTLKSLVLSNIQGYWNFSGNTTFSKFFWKSQKFGGTEEMIGFSIEKKEWQPIPIPENLALSLQKICSIYKENPHLCFYETILQCFIQRNTDIASVLHLISFDAKEEFINELIRYYAENIQAMIVDMKPFLEYLQIDILVSDPTNPLCEKNYEFGTERQEAGYKIQNEIRKKPSYTYGVLYPSCWEILQSLKSLFFRTQRWHDAFFWYKAFLYRTQGNLQSLLSEIREIILSMDQEMYGDENKSAEERKKYEDLLWSLQESLQNEGYPISFAAGSYEQAKKIFADIRYEFASASLPGEIIPGYPLTVEDRPFTGYSFLPDRMVYCRGHQPEMLGYLKKLNFAMPAMRDVILSLVQTIEADWPENKESLSREILEKLVKPMHYISREKQQERESILSSLAELHSAMKSDGMKGLYPHPAILGKLVQKKDHGICKIAQEEYSCFQEIFSDLPAMSVAEIQDFILEGDVPSQALFKISVGMCPWGLDLFHKILSHLNDWIREWEVKRASANIPTVWILNAQEILSSQDFFQYSKGIVSEKQIQDGYYPKFSGCTLDLAQFHRQFFSASPKDTLPGFFSLIQLLDTIVSLWYCEDSNPANKLENSRKMLEQDTIELIEEIHSHSLEQDAIFPVRIQDNISQFQSIWYLSSQGGTLAIRQRKFPAISGKKDFVYPTEHWDKVVLLQGNVAKFDHSLLEPLQNFFLNTWCLLQQESNSLNRQSYLQNWERAYFGFHSSGTWQGIVDIFNAFYKISEGLEKALGNYQKFCEWESRLNFLENYLRQNHGIVKIFVRRGDMPEIKEEIKQNFQFQEFSIKSQGMQYRQGGIIRVLKPAFIRNDRTRIQMGEALLQA